MRSTNRQRWTDGRRRWPLGPSRRADRRDPVAARARRCARPTGRSPSPGPSIAHPLLRVVAVAVALLVGGLGFAVVAAGQRTAFDDEAERQAMVSVVESRLAERVRPNPEVLEAMRSVPRHYFVPRSLRSEAYRDTPLSIGHGQTISQPSVVAMMTSLLDLGPGDKVLEIGTGSGYHAAVMSRVAGEVYSIEIVDVLARKAARLLDALNYHNVKIRIGDGYHGWGEHAPFDAILLTAAPPEVPPPLLEQLKVGGKMVLPLGSGSVQELQVLTKTEEGVEISRVSFVRFVPMTGEVLHPRE